ncbi:MAG TPA: acyl-CoA dehydrogenase family protein [Microbacteriaceae bacterium]
MFTRVESVNAPSGAASRYVDIAEGLRGKLAETAAEVDRAGTYPEANMRLIAESGLGDLMLPESAGGAAPDEPADELLALVQILKNLGAGESSTAQIWAFGKGQSVSLTGRNSPLPEATRLKLVDEVRNEGVRFCSPQAERYKTGRFDFRVPIRRVDGGVVIDGTKYFGTGSAGAKYAHSNGLMEGFASVAEGGAYNVLVDLASEGVELHDDWDNMGQRATGSNAITYHNVFVPDGYHWPSDDGAFKDPNNSTGIFFQFGLTSVLLGIGVGAMDALVAHLNARATFPGVFEDTSTRYQIGLHAARLAAAEASLMSAAAKAVDFRKNGTTPRAEVSIAGIQAKISVVEATLGIAGDMHKFLGGQSSANIYGYDRFWRNARTLALQDVMDVKAQQMGAWTLKNEAPPISWVS